MEVKMFIFFIKYGWKYYELIGEFLRMKMSLNSTSFGLFLIIHNIQLVYGILKWFELTYVGMYNIKII